MRKVLYLESQTEELFLDLFSDVFGPDKASLLYPLFTLSAYTGQGSRRNASTRQTSVKITSIAQFLCIAVIVIPPCIR